MDPAVIHFEQFHISKVNVIQGLTDADRQIAVHSPAAAQAAIDFGTETNIAVHNLHRRPL
jgi:hypothetical protein